MGATSLTTGTVVVCYAMGKGYPLMSNRLAKEAEQPCEC